MKAPWGIRTGGRKIDGAMLVGTEWDCRCCC